MFSKLGYEHGYTFWSGLCAYVCRWWWWLLLAYSSILRHVKTGRHKKARGMPGASCEHFTAASIQVNYSHISLSRLADINGNGTLQEVPVSILDPSWRIGTWSDCWCRRPCHTTRQQAKPRPSLSTHVSLSFSLPLSFKTYLSMPLSIYFFSKLAVSYHHRF